MKQNKIGYLFPFFALFVIFSDEIFFSIVSILGADLESGMKAREAVVIGGVAYLLMGADILKNRLSQRHYLQLAIMFLILVLYYATSLFSTRAVGNENYRTSLLAYGALCVPSCYVGIRLSSGLYDKGILELLPFFLIFVSFIVGSAIWAQSLTGGLLGQEGAFNYQNASYYIAFCFSYIFFYLFFVSEKNGTTFQRIITVTLYGLLFICAIGTLLGGGRGAFVYLVLITAYLIFRLMKKSRGGVKVKYVLILVVVAIAMVYLASSFNVLESAGVNRLIERLNTEGDDMRKELWRKSIKVFRESPIWGHGLGSIWWTVGFYSHNIVSDLLAETGLIGTGIIISVLFRIFARQTKRSYFSGFDLFLLLIYIGALVHDSFSGYWIISPKLYLLFGYVFGLDSHRIYPQNQLPV